MARPRLAASAAIVVAKYARVSTLDQLDGFGLEDQDKISNGWLDRHPEATVYDEYVDEAVSGALESRPEMDRLVVDAHKQHFNRILVPKVDRIGRTARAAYQWAWNMADIGVYFISVTEGIDTSTDAGWSQFMQYVTFSEMEWRRIKERTFAGRELKISYGGWPGGPAPYGYKIAQDTSWVGKRRKKFSVLVTDEHESLVLDVAVGLLVDDGKNFTEACDELNERKLFTRSGVPWTVGNLRNRLYSETIHDGYVVYRKTNRGNGKNTTLRYEDGTPVYGDQVKIGVPPIFSEERARVLMETMKKIGFRNGRSTDRVYPLSVRIHGRCGEDYTGTVRGGGSNARSYRCNGLRAKGESCGEPYFDADDIEGVIWAELTKLLKDEERLKAMAAEWVNSLPGDKEKYEKRVAEYTKKIAEQDHLINDTVPQYMRERIDPKVVAAAVRTMQDDLEKYKKERSFAEQWLEAYAEYDRQAHNLVDIANNARERLDDMSLEERKEIFDMFNLSVVPGKMDNVAKPGVRCSVQHWHWETGTLVPPDPTDVEWDAVLETLRPFFDGKKKKHFTSKYDIRQQFCGMLHRLRHGLSWVEMPLTWGPISPMRERQLTWFKAGGWSAIMETMRANERGVEAYKRPTLPQLTVTGQLRAGLLAEVRSEEPRPKPVDPNSVKTDGPGYTVLSQTAQIGFET
ncbi:recombinase family protein, partial [Streptomyces sp. NPDC059080]|uniref:recombinase family protein n=1 Tax=Streptomyces sp. NPDC059080 TaxID=3346718 RepID=UPI0036A2F5FF